MGKSSSGSMRHGCPFCNCAQPYKNSGDLYKLEDLIQHHKVLRRTNSYNILRFGLNFQDFVHSGAKKSKAMKFSNVINEPVLSGSPDKLVLDLLNIPELHLLIGRC